jgi:hypothetical protein
LHVVRPGRKTPPSDAKRALCRFTDDVANRLPDASFATARDDLVDRERTAVVIEISAVRVKQEQ